MVFSEYLEHNPRLRLSEVLDELLANERIARKGLFKFFAESDIGHVDALPALKGSIEHELYARAAADMHPNKNGYRVIGEAVAVALDKMKGK